MSLSMKNYIRQHLRQRCTLYRPTDPGGMGSGATVLGSAACRTQAVQPSERHEAHQRHGLPLADLECHFVDLPESLEYLDRLVFEDAPARVYEIVGLDEVRGSDGSVVYVQAIVRQVSGSGAGGVLG